MCADRGLRLQNFCTFLRLLFKGVAIWGREIRGILVPKLSYVLENDDTNFDSICADCASRFRICTPPFACHEKLGA